MDNPDGSSSDQFSELTLYDEVGPATADQLIKGIHRANKEGKPNDPIALYINSPGGSVIAGLRILDAMKASKRPITTVCVSACFSMAGIIFISGDHRVMLPHSLVLLHDGQSGAQGTTAKVYSEIAVFQKLDNDLEQIVCKITGLSQQEVRDREAKDWWLDATESVKYHVADEIVNLEQYPVN